MATYNGDAPIAGTENLLLGIFDGAFAAVAKAFEKPMKALRKWMAKSVKVAQRQGAQTSVVILGGGWCGAIIAKHFDGREGFRVTLCDPKEYFEEITAMPKAFCSPGASLDDIESVWPRTVVPYKEHIVKHGKLVAGLAMAVNTEHKFVEVGTERQVVPYDYLNPKPLALNPNPYTLNSKPAPSAR